MKESSSDKGIEKLRFVSATKLILHPYLANLIVDLLLIDLYSSIQTMQLVAHCFLQHMVSWEVHTSSQKGLRTRVIGDASDRQGTFKLYTSQEGDSYGGLP